MTSRELTTAVSTFGHVVISAWLWCIFPYNLMQDIFIQSKVTDIFRKLKMAAAAVLDCQFMWIWPFRRVDSAVFVYCAKFGSNICYSHWDRRTFASDLHLMTSRELTSGFDFFVTWSSPRRCGASSHIIWCKISLSGPKLLTFFPKFKMAAAAILDFQCMWNWICHSGVLIVWYLCSVPNLVLISVIVTEINAHMLQTFIWWRHAN